MTSHSQSSSNRSIVHVVPRYPPGLGGVEKVAQYLARNQHKLGMRVQVLTSDEGKNQLRQEVEPFRISRLKSFSVGHTPVMPALLPRLFDLDRDSIIHLHFPPAYASEMVWIYAHMKGHPYLTHFHGIPGPSGPAGFLLRAYEPLLLRAVLRGAAAVAVLTEEHRSMVTEQFGVESTRVEIIPNGVDETFLYDGQRFLHGKPRLLFVGRLAIQKNLILLLRALNGISHQFETTLVGDGELETDLKQAVGEMRLENVRFHGIADGAELRELYRSADVFVLPSEREGMPLVLLEAMAMGLPIVATDIPGNRDLVVDGQNGLLVPPEDPMSLRQALLHITADPNRYQYMSETSRHFADKYSWEAVCADFERLYARAGRDRR
jgi:glycosyltransferase involved in cell wall biosynthesis